MAKDSRNKRGRARRKAADLRKAAARKGAATRGRLKRRLSRRRTSKTTTPSGHVSASKRDELPAKAYAFPKERKEPLHDAKHVRNAVARFNQVEGVSDTERDQAWKRIKKAAKKHGVEVSAKSWRDLDGKRPKKTKSEKKKKEKAKR